MSHIPTLAAIRLELDAAGAGRGETSRVVQSLRDAHALGAALTPRHRQALDEILTRLESGSWFREESCSFSQDELRAALTEWLLHAHAYLSRTGQTALPISNTPAPVPAPSRRLAA